MHHRTCTSFETGHIGWRLTLFCPVCLRCRISSYPCPFSAQHGLRPLLAFVEPLLSLFLQGKTSSPTSPHLAKPVLILCTHVAHASSHHVIWLFNEYSTNYESLNRFFQCPRHSTSGWARLHWKWWSVMPPMVESVSNRLQCLIAHSTVLMGRMFPSPYRDLSSKLWLTFVWPLSQCNM